MAFVLWSLLIGPVVATDESSELLQTRKSAIQDNGTIQVQDAFSDEFNGVKDEWTYTDNTYVNKEHGVWKRMADHSYVGVRLSKKKGIGLQLVLDKCDNQCEPSGRCQSKCLKGNGKYKCGGESGGGWACEGCPSCPTALMTAGHLVSNNKYGYGDYEAIIRAPHEKNSNKVADGVRGYFGLYNYDPQGEITIGFKKGNSWVNGKKVNYDPDRTVWCEIQADTGKYQIYVKSVSFNIREDFHKYVLKRRPNCVSFWVDDQLLHKQEGNKGTVTTPLDVRLIIRPDEYKVTPQSKMEFDSFTFTPWDARCESWCSRSTHEEKCKWKSCRACSSCPCDVSS